MTNWIYGPEESNEALFYDRNASDMSYWFNAPQNDIHMDVCHICIVVFDKRKQELIKNLKQTLPKPIPLSYNLISIH